MGHSVGTFHEVGTRGGLHPVTLGHPGYSRNHTRGPVTLLGSQAPSAFLSAKQTLEGKLTGKLQILPLLSARSLMSLGPISVFLKAGHQNVCDLERYSRLPAHLKEGTLNPKVRGFQEEIFVCLFNREADVCALGALGDQACITAPSLALMEPKTLRCNFNGLH